MTYLAGGVEGWIELGALFATLVVLAGLVVFRIVWKIRQLARFARLADQLQVQLAGCGVAALGGTSEAQVATREMFGWSPAYDDVLRLRHRHDLLHDVVLNAARLWMNCDCPITVNRDGVMRTGCIHERAHQIMSTRLFRGVTISPEDLPGCRFAGT